MRLGAAGGAVGARHRPFQQRRRPLRVALLPRDECFGGQAIRSRNPHLIGVQQARNSSDGVQLVGRSGVKRQDRDDDVSHAASVRFCDPTDHGPPGRKSTGSPRR